MNRGLGWSVRWRSAVFRTRDLALACLPVGLALVIAVLEIAGRYKLRRVPTAWLTHDHGWSWTGALLVGAPMALWAWGALVALAAILSARWLIPRLVGSDRGAVRALRRKVWIASLVVFLASPITLMLCGAMASFAVLIAMWALCWLWPSLLLVIAAYRRRPNTPRTAWWASWLAATALFALLGVAADGTLGWLGLRSDACVTLVGGGRPDGMAFAPDGRTVLVRDDAGAVRRYDPDRGTSAPVDAEVEAVDWTRSTDASGSVIASLSDKRIMLRVIADGLDRAWMPHSEDQPARVVVVRPDGGLIATGGNDNVIRLWRPSGALVRTLYGHSDSITGLCWSRDGSRLASSSVDGDLRVWALR